MSSSPSDHQSDHVILQDHQARQAEFQDRQTEFQDRQTEFDRYRAWKDAIDNVFVVNHLGWDDSKPRESISNLLAVEHSMSIDPAISEDAAKLRDHYLPALLEAIELVGFQVVGTSIGYCHNLLQDGAKSPNLYKALTNLQNKG